jgi:hypothetical protein
MACATLKRAYDWDPLNSPNQAPAGPSVSQSPVSKSPMNVNSGMSGSAMAHTFTNSSSPSTHSHAHRPSKRRCLFAQHHHHNQVRATPPKEPSPFSFVHSRFSAGKSSIRSASTRSFAFDPLLRLFVAKSPFSSVNHDNCAVPTSLLSLFPSLSLSLSHQLIWPDWLLVNQLFALIVTICLPFFVRSSSRAL